MARAGDTAPGDAGELDAQIAEVFGGPLDGFVTRRATLARELRAAGRRDEAERVKALRKPKRAAWALDAGRLADPGAAAELADAVTALEAAPSSGGDVRAAIARLRAAEHAFVTIAGGAARDHGSPVDPTALAAALRAVVADPDLRAALQLGRLVDTAPVDGGSGPAPPEAAAPPRRRTTERAGAATGRKAASRRAAPSDRAEPPAAPGEPDRPPRPDRRALAAARRAVTKAEEGVARAERAAREAADDAATSDAAAEKAEEAAGAARRRADDALDRARRARQVAAERAADHEADATELAAATEALRRLEG
jgi:hypothetical protein